MIHQQVLLHLQALKAKLIDNHPWLASLRQIWLGIFFIAAAWYLVRYWNQISNHHFVLAPALLAFALNVLGRAVSAPFVTFALARCRVVLSVAASFYVYAVADVAKYIPGGIWSVVSRVGFYRALNMRPLTVFQALVIEQLWSTGSAAAFGLLFYGLARWGHTWGGWGNVVFLTIFPLWILALLAGERFTPAPASLKQLPALALAQVCQAVLIGAGFAVLLPYNIPAFIGAGAFLIAFAAGMAVPFVPGGVGVREAVMGFLLLPFLDFSAIGYYLLLSRAIWVAADMGFAALVTITCRTAWIAAVKTRDATCS